MAPRRAQESIDCARMPRPRPVGSLWNGLAPRVGLALGLLLAALAIAGCGGATGTTTSTPGSGGSATGRSGLSPHLTAAGYAAAAATYPVGDRVRALGRTKPGAAVAELRGACATLGPSSSDQEVQVIRKNCRASAAEDIALLTLKTCSGRAVGSAQRQCTLNALEVLATSEQQQRQTQLALLNRLAPGECRALVALGLPETTQVLTSARAVLTAAAAGGDVASAANALNAALKAEQAASTRNTARGRREIGACKP